MPNIKQFKTRSEYNEWYQNYRDKNRETIRIYNREYNRNYRKIHGYSNEKKWRDSNPEKVKAERILRFAVKNGLIKQEVCKKCGNERTVAHHPDYNNPLKVIWLCPIHHKDIHRKLLTKSLDRNTI